MLAKPKPKNWKFGCRAYHDEADSHESSKGLFASDPVAVAQLQLLTSSEVADLDAITEVICGDAGLTIQLLQLGARTLGDQADDVMSMEELIVLLGLEQLRTMAAEITLLAPRSRMS